MSVIVASQFIFWLVFVLVGAFVVDVAWLVVHSFVPLLTVDLGLVVVVLVVVRIGGTDLTWVSVVIGTLGDNIALFRPCHCEVQWAMLGILVVIGIVLMSMDVLRGHTMVFRVHVMVRLRLVMVLIGRVMLLLLLNDGNMMVGILMQRLEVANTSCMVSRCHNGCVVHWGHLVMRKWGGVMRDRGNVVSHGGSVMRHFVVHCWGDRGVVERRLVSDGRVVHWSHAMVHWGGVVRSHMV